MHEYTLDGFDQTKKGGNFKCVFCLWVGGNTLSFLSEKKWSAFPWILMSHMEGPFRDFVKKILVAKPCLVVGKSNFQLPQCFIENCFFQLCLSSLDWLLQREGAIVWRISSPFLRRKVQLKLKVSNRVLAAKLVVFLGHNSRIKYLNFWKKREKQF